MLVFYRTAALVPTFKVKRLYGESPVCLLSPSSSLGDVGIVLSHNSGFVYL